MERNVIINADCMDVMRDMPKNSVDCILTDLPYNELGRRSNNGFDHVRHIKGGAQDNTDDLDLQAVLNEMWRICKGSFYIFCGFGQISEIHEFFLGHGCSPRMIIWEKTNPVPTNGEHTWLFGIEPCMFAKKTGATFNLHCENTVLRYPIAEPTGHPTPKHVTLMGKLVLASTNEGDLVFDPFAGGATTAIACVRTKRDFICVERDPNFYELARKRVNLERQQLSLF